MPERGISRFIPFLVILALLLGLALYFAPGVIRAWKFRGTANALLSDIRGGNLSRVPSYAVPEQKQLLATFLSRADVQGHVADIASLKLSHYHREEDHVWATVTAKLKDDRGIGQGNLRWVWDGSGWRLDALNSYVSQGIGMGTSRGMRIGDYVDGSDLGEFTR